MLPNDRQKQIFDFLSVKKSATVQQLCRNLFASPATIRRDLDHMERQGLLQRTHGGAVLLEGGSGELSIFMREAKNTAAKGIIGELASCFIKDSYTVFLDPSSSACSIVPFLSRCKNVSVITNGLHCALTLSQQTSCDVYIPGGQLVSRSNSVVGSDVLSALAGYCGDVAVISCSGLSLEMGVTEPSIEQSRIKYAMLCRAKTRILLCDRSKFGQTFLSRTCGPADFDYLITDRQPEAAYVEYYAGTTCELVFPDA